jgi:hypothetical protein
MKILRSLFLGLLVFIGFILIVSEPSNDDNFYIVMLIKTVLGFALWGFAWILYKHWYRMK